MTKFRELQQRKCSSDDIKKISIRSEDKWRDLADRLENAYSYYDGNQIVGIVGGAKINDNTCEVWAILDECAKRYVREIYFYAGKLLDDLQQHFERIQAIVRADLPVAIHFIERLGFKKEGLMKKFIDGNNFNLYGRVK